MSWLAYERFTLQPDFSKAPQYGIDDERDTVDTPGGSRGFAAWTGHTDKTFLFEFQTHAAEEWRQLREFFDRHGGRARAFYLPTWQHDFELASAAAIGETVIELAGHWFADNVTEDRPDTLGRTLFIVNQAGQAAVHRVISFGEAGGNDVVQLESPLAIALEPGRTMVGFCHLARLTNDTIESEHLSTDHARASLGFRSVIQTRRVNQTEFADGPEISSMNAVADIVAEDADPLYDNPRVVTATGPFVRNGPQAENYQTEWVATLSTATNVVTVVGPSTFTTPLYNAPAPARQIALVFDALSREVLAWELDGQVWIAYTNGGGTISRLNFPAFSPVAYNTFAIDSTVNSGTATVAVFYLKPSDSTIFCRIASEDFATERRYCDSPLAPLYLHAARRHEGRLELVGMDAGHRLARWRSATYLTPPEIQISHTILEAVAGTYSPITVEGFMPDETPTTILAAVSGEYRSIAVMAPTMTEAGGKTSFDTVVPGNYYNVTVAPPPVTEEGGDTALDTTVPGSYLLVAKSAAKEDSGTTILNSIGGSYA